MQRRLSRSHVVAVSLSILGLLYYSLTYHHVSTEPEPPLPGTYQYFRDVDFHSKTHKLGAVSHCDARYALDRALSEDELRETLKALIHSYSSSMRDLEIKTWVAHGALLGWYWNQKLLPWDTDLDVQMSIDSLASLVAKYNMTEFEHKVEPQQHARKYVLDINPHHTIHSRRDVANKIDGRWIDTTNGKFIDITAIHGASSSDELWCKDGHEYKVQDIFPLQRTELESVGVFVPASSRKVLSDEYGPRSLTQKRFHWFADDN